MSQDDIKCIKCNKFCGYDDGKGHWDGADLAICEECKDILWGKFIEFFGCGYTSNDYGIEIDWGEVDALLSRLERREGMRVFIISDKDRCERSKVSPQYS